jgi:sugar phosphate isomerase/epimerase
MMEVANMKLSFSTVGCPRWTWSEIISAASDLGYNGIELRGLGDDLFLPDAKLFRRDGLAATRRGLDSHGLSVPCIASDCLLHLRERDEIAAARAHIDLAAGLGAPCVRLLGDSWGHPGENVNKALVKDRLLELIPYAADKNVTLLIETNGVWADTEKLAVLLSEINSPEVAVLWDVLHPVAHYGETAEQTYRNIGSWVRHLHLKDAKDNVLKMLGYGELPLKGIFTLLKNGGYDGWLSLEWTKRWNEELEEPGVAFAHFVYMAKKLWKEA